MAASTTVQNLTSAAYVSIGAAPMLLQVLAGSAAQIIVSPSQPGPTDVGLKLSAGAQPLAITGVGGVYARSVGPTGKLVVAVLA